MEALVVRVLSLADKKRNSGVSLGLVLQPTPLNPFSKISSQPATSPVHITSNALSLYSPTCPQNTGASVVGFDQKLGLKWTMEM